MVRTTHWLGILLLVCSSTGCGHFYDYVDSTAYHIKCKSRAKLAWMDARELYGCVSHPYNFGEGFRAGYIDVCLGNDTGCVPPFPPRRYWSSCYLNCEGRAKAAAWSDGFAHGALAACSDGCAGQCRIATTSGCMGSGCSGSGGGGDLFGTALKGYRPPQGNNPRGGYPPGGEPGIYDAIPGGPPTYSPPASGPYVPDNLDVPMGGEGELAPEPSPSGSGLEAWRNPISPTMPRAAEAYHAPTF
ncbi:MAG: hypothetical protein KDA93_17930 [Planctomycetaceae bacterium]|nr:hypothetical protein [Planctomycetaceae bacterium]